MTIETNNNDNTHDLLLKEFNALFHPGKTYPTLPLLRSELDVYGQKHNIVMSTKNSNYRSIHLWCKHAGVYVQTRRRSKKTASIKEVKPRKRDTQRSDCPCYIKAKLINESWVIEHCRGDHNHSIPENRTAYSERRRQTEETKELILQLLDDGHRVGSVMNYLRMVGINNIIKKDIENLQQRHRKSEQLSPKKNDQNKSTVAILPMFISNSQPSPAIQDSSNGKQQQFTFLPPENLLYPSKSTPW